MKIHKRSGTFAGRSVCGHVRKNRAPLTEDNEEVTCAHCLIFLKTRGHISLETFKRLSGGT